MKDRVKKAIHQGDLISVKQILKANVESIRSLVESIDAEDLRILEVNEQKPDWEFAGYGTNLLPDDDSFKYRMDMDDKYVIRYKRTPVIGSYLSCLTFVNELRNKVELSPLVSLTSKKKPNISVNDLDSSALRGNEFASCVLNSHENSGINTYTMMMLLAGLRARAAKAFSDTESKSESCKDTTSTQSRSKDQDKGMNVSAVDQLIQTLMDSMDENDSPRLSGCSPH